MCMRTANIKHTPIICLVDFCEYVEPNCPCEFAGMDNLPGYNVGYSQHQHFNFFSASKLKVGME